MKKLVTMALLCVVVVVPAQTVRRDSVADKVHQVKEIVVTENRKQREVSSTSPLHVIGQGALLHQGITDVVDALHRLPGVTLRDYGGAGGLKTISVRGFGAQHTGVSYDGILLSECQSGEIDVSRYSLNNLEHISLIVGDNDDIFIPAKNASVPAMVHLQTQRLPTADTQPHLTAQLRAGSFGYASPFVKYEQNLSGRLSFSAVGEYVYAENDYPFMLRNVSVVTEERRKNSRMNSGYGEMNFVWKASRAGQLSGKVYYYDNDRQLPGQVRYYTNNSNEALRDRNAFGQLQYLTHNHSNLSLKWNAKFNWSQSDYRSGVSSGALRGACYWQREAYTSAALLWVPMEHWAFDYSADYSYNNLTSTLFSDIRPYRHTILQTATAKYTHRRLTAIARLLHSLYLNDAKDGDGARNMRRLSPSISLSYKLLAGADLYIRASYKNIFRAPTFNENYFFHYGSTDLLPENTDQFNLGLTWRSRQKGALTMQATLDGYVNHVADKIVAVPYNMFIWHCINVGKVRAIGLDATLNAAWRLGSRHLLLAASNYSFQQVRNRTNPQSPYYNYQIAYTPEHSGSASLAWENPWLNLSFHGTGVSRRWINNEHYDESKISAYADFGITAYRNFRFGKHRFEWRADVKNLFNRQYEIVKLYPMPRRNYQLSIKYQF
jgi:outer membrane cobalamin receptor